MGTQYGWVSKPLALEMEHLSTGALLGEHVGEHLYQVRFCFFRRLHPPRALSDV